jgi:hypothetical protein
MKSKKSAVRFSGASSDLLHNKYVLYISFFFAILTAARYLFNFNLEAIIIFVVIGFLTTYFSKNMIVVLLTTTIGTNFIMMFKNRRTPSYYNIMEGMETKPDAAAAAAPDAKAANATPAGAVPPAAVPPAAVPAVPAAQMNPADMSKMISAAMSSIKGGVDSAPMPGTPINAEKFTNTNKKSEGMTQLSPASYGGSSGGDAALSSMFKGMAPGATGQKNQAYNTLNSLGGSANTGELMGQQAEMINNLKSIEPILQTAEKFLDKFENSSISRMFQNMGGSIPGLSLLTGGGGNNGGNGLNPASIGA